MSRFFSDAAAYDRFMGRYSRPLASAFLDFVALPPKPASVLDVGCGPGALTGELVARFGSERVAAVDPTEGFVEAARHRHPGVDVRTGTAESLPFGDDEFDAALAQLVVHFMADPVAGLGEMARVTRPGGLVAACVWDLERGASPLSLFWQAARDLDPLADEESNRPGTHGGQLTALFVQAGLDDVEEGSVSTRVEHATFDEWWEPFTMGVGPAGAYTAALDVEARERLRQHCRELLPEEPLVIEARAWAARGRRVRSASASST